MQSRARPDGVTIGEVEYRRPRRRRRPHHPPTKWHTPSRPAPVIDRARIAVGAGTAEGASEHRHGFADVPLARLMFSSELTVAITAAASGCRTRLEVAHAVGEATSPGGGVQSSSRSSKGAPGKPGAAGGARKRRAQRRGERAGREAPISCRSGKSTALSSPRTGLRDVPASMCSVTPSNQTGAGAPADIALTAAATGVVSRQGLQVFGLRRIVLDCGSKTRGSDRPAWATGFGCLMTTPMRARGAVGASSRHRCLVRRRPIPAGGNTLRADSQITCLTTNP